MKAVPGKYMRVGDKKGPLVIGGALKKMEEDPSFMYLPMLRVAGPEEDIKNYLKEKKATEDFDDKSAKEALKSAYTVASLEKKSYREAYEKEVSEANDARASVTSTKAEDRQVNLYALIPILKQYKDEKKNNPNANKVVTKTNVDLKAKIASLGEGKVLDVTLMKRKGTDTKKVTFKDGGKRKRLSQMEGDFLYNVVYDPSNRSTAAMGVKNFLFNRGFEASKIDPIVEAIKKGETVNISKAKSPTRSPLLSPKRGKARGKGKGKAKEDEVDDILDEL
jgi:hypothetical protein